MSSPRKSRLSRTAPMKAPSGPWASVRAALTDADLLLRLAITGLALVILTLLIGGWRIPFPYRLGDEATDGVSARIDFDRVNERKTDLARLEVEDQIVPIYRYSPLDLFDLQYLLRQDLFEVAPVDSPQDLAAETRAAFGILWSASDEGDDSEDSKNSGWLRLKEVVGNRESAEARIDALVAEFNQFSAPLRVHGVLDPNELSRRDLRPEQVIRVRNRDVPDQETEVIVANVLLAEMLKTTGALGRSWDNFPGMKKLQPLMERWLVQRVKPNLEFDETATIAERALARQSVAPIRDTYKRGTLLVAPGTRLDDESLAILKSQHEAVEERIPITERLVRLATVLGLLLVLATIHGTYLVRNEPALVGQVSRLLIYLTVVVTSIASALWLSFDPWRAEIIPLLCTVMVLAIAYNQVLAAITGFGMSLILVLSMGRGVGEFVLLMSGIAAAVVPLNQVSSRSKVVKIGFGAAVTYFLVSWGESILAHQQLDRMLTDFTLLRESLRGAAWCLAAGYLVAGSLPFIEQTFGMVTDISLLELSDVSHPLLQELVRRAPGTYNHSIGVATISETAADAIGANGLLCRVGAYFHDIGKMMKPQYFVENMTAGQDSRHEHLNPAMSTLVIIGHVKDGVDLAQRQGLPRPLIDFIEQHHGTTLVEYFFHAATKQAESDPEHRSRVEESSFRYPGPKPQTREAAVLMIADAVEGASRTLTEPTPKRIETLVHDIAMKRLLDGQFDECSLTLRELAIVEDSLTKSLIGIYHGRIKYPEQRTA